MKGIILAGGTGSRLYPMTSSVCKQLLPVYDKPMIYYPLSTLMLLGIKEFLIISTPTDTPLIENHLGDGSQLGLTIDYKVQQEPKGIAEAFILGEEFIGDDTVALILGDNIFHLGRQIQTLSEKVKDHTGARILGIRAQDPERFGVIEFDENYQVVSLEEKPQNPKSDYVVPGLYFYDSKVVDYAKNLKPSLRGELEITDINKIYLNNNELEASPFGRGAVWADVGTVSSLLETAHFISLIENMQNLKIGCIEEVAYNMGFINEEGLRNIVNTIKAGSPYRDYLEQFLPKQPTVPFTKTEIEDVVVFEPRIFEDSRGYFFECYNSKTYEEAGIKANFVQDNQSKSEYGTIRGLHFQTGDHAQAKLVRVISGKILDVAVDLRPNSPTFGQHVAVELSSLNQKQLYIPRGFAHGFSVLSETAIVAYKCDNFYAPQADGGLMYDDEILDIDWKIAPEDVIISEKDQNHPTFKDYCGINTLEAIKGTPITVTEKKRA